MWRSVSGVRDSEGHCCSTLSSSVTHPGGDQATHTALLGLSESISLLTVYPKKIVFEANPLGSSVCFATRVDREWTAGRRLWGQPQEGSCGKKPAE